VVDPESEFYLTKAVIHKSTIEIYTHQALGTLLKELYVQSEFVNGSAGNYKIITEGLLPGSENGLVSYS